MTRKLISLFIVFLSFFAVSNTASAPAKTKKAVSAKKTTTATKAKPAKSNKVTPVRTKNTAPAAPTVNTSYNRSLVYIGLSSQGSVSVERIQKMNNILLNDIRKRLVSHLRFTDLSEAYVYSQNTNLSSIAKTRNVRWVVSGKVEMSEEIDIFKPDIVLYLYDATVGKNIETVTFSAGENDNSKFENNVEYLYSKIIEANMFFAKTTSTQQKNKTIKQESKFSADKVVILDFHAQDGVPDKFTSLTNTTRETIFQRESKALKSADEEQMALVSMRSRDQHAMRRLRGIGVATESKWIITGTLSQKENDTGTHCSIKLFDVEKQTAVSSIEFTSNDFQASDIVARRRLENFLLLISAETDYSLHKTNDYRVMYAHEEPVKKDNNVENTLTGSVFDESTVIVSRYGSLTRLNENGTVFNTINARGSGLKKFTASAGVQIDQYGRIYTMDTAEKKIILFDKDGSFISEFFYGMINADRFIVVSSGHIFIPDTEKHMLRVYTKEGSHINDVPVQLSTPFSLFLFNGTPVLLSSTDDYYDITFFTQTGSIITTKHLGIYKKSFAVNSAAMDNNENLYCLDSSRGLLICVSKTGKVLWIQKNLSGVSPNKLENPTSVCVDQMGNNIAVIDQKKQRLIAFRKKTETVAQENKKNDY